MFIAFELNRVRRLLNQVAVRICALAITVRSAVGVERAGHRAENQAETRPHFDPGSRDRS